MADGDKKEEKKELSFWEDFWLSFDLLEWAIIGLILFALAVRAHSFFVGGATASHFSQWLSVRPDIQAQIDSVRVWLSETVQSLTAISTGFSVLLAVVIGYLIFRQSEVDKAWHETLYSETSPQPLQMMPPAGIIPTGAPVNLPTGDIVGIRLAAVSRKPNARWQKVLEHIASDNPSDWRLAILEADIVLEETLDQAGYVGDTLGDKLKNAERRPFSSLNAAWEAHKIRNTIAHQGQSFELNQREARRTIALFEAVFREFGTV